MNLKQLKKQLLKDKKFREEYFKVDLMFEVSEMLIEARIKKGITQEELAKKIGTKQPSIARVENGNVMPSLSFLEKIAKALDTYLVPPRFAFLEPRHPLLIDETRTETNSFKMIYEGEELIEGIVTNTYSPLLTDMPINFEFSGKNINKLSMSTH